MTDQQLELHFEAVMERFSLDPSPKRDPDPAVRAGRERHGFRQFARLTVEGASALEIAETIEPPYLNECPYDVREWLYVTATVQFGQREPGWLKRVEVAQFRMQALIDRWRNERDEA